MVIPLIVLVTIPIFLGIVTVLPFEMPEPQEQMKSESHEQIESEPNVSFLYIFLMIIWLFFLLRILLQLKKGRYKITDKY